MLTPLTFTPIFKSMLWGGRRLPDFLGIESPHNDPIGEAWVLSDVDGSLSVVAEGIFRGQTLRTLIQRDPAAIFGDKIPADLKFPLLMKFIDARQELSVQVHPNDEQAVRLQGAGQRGKTEAWVIHDADPATSKIYAGFRPGMTADTFRAAMMNGSTHEMLHSFTPQPGDCVFLEAGTVHAIGANILLFEVQQTSDITYRLYDWGRVDAKTGLPRELHLDKGLTCSNFAAGPCHPLKPLKNAPLQELVECPYFSLKRVISDSPMTVGEAGACRVIIVQTGVGELHWQDWVGELRPGRVYLLPASVGECRVLPQQPVTLLECGLAG